MCSHFAVSLFSGPWCAGFSLFSFPGPIFLDPDLVPGCLNNFTIRGRLSLGWTLSFSSPSLFPLGILMTMLVSVSMVILSPPEASLMPGLERINIDGKYHISENVLYLTGKSTFILNFCGLCPPVCPSVCPITITII